MEQRCVASGPRGAVSNVLVGLLAVLSSEFGGWPLGLLLLQQSQGVPLRDGAQLLLLRPLELGGVSDLGGGVKGGH